MAFQFEAVENWAKTLAEKIQSLIEPSDKEQDDIPEPSDGEQDGTANKNGEILGCSCSPTGAKDSLGELLVGWGTGYYLVRRVSKHKVLG